jgi:membrane protein required for beta-lactamase induction
MSKRCGLVIALGSGRTPGSLLLVLVLVLLVLLLKLLLLLLLVLVLLLLLLLLLVLLLGVADISCRSRNQANSWSRCSRRPSACRLRCAARCSFTHCRK